MTTISEAPDSILASCVIEVSVKLLGKSPADALVLTLKLDQEPMDVKKVHERLHSILGLGAAYLEKAVLMELSRIVSTTRSPGQGTPPETAKLLEDAKILFSG